MSEDFYDKVAKKFGGYGYGNDLEPEYVKEFPAGDPEQVFKEKILELSDKNKIALDIGCADGKFTLSVAPFFQKVFGIDTSRVNLEIAKDHGDDERSKNVEYLLQDASHTTFADSFFDLAYCRRGPTYYEEYYRILKPRGHYIEIDIGEKDCTEIKKVFGRGQGFGKWNNSILEKNLETTRNLGFKSIYARDFEYFEYYRTYEDLDLFLQGVPIFQDFDSDKDRALLQEYANKFSSEKGIQLSRHRVVMVSEKN